MAMVRDHACSLLTLSRTCKTAIEEHKACILLGDSRTTPKPTRTPTTLPTRVPTPLPTPCPRLDAWLSRDTSPNNNSTVDGSSSSPDSTTTAASLVPPRIKSGMIITLQGADGKFASNGGGGGTRIDAEHAGHWERFHVLSSSDARAGIRMQAGCNATTCNMTHGGPPLHVTYTESGKIGLKLAGKFLSNNHGIVKTTTDAIIGGPNEEFKWRCVGNCGESPEESTEDKCPEGYYAVITLESHPCQLCKMTTATLRAQNGGRGWVLRDGNFEQCESEGGRAKVHHFVLRIFSLHLTHDLTFLNCTRFQCALCQHEGGAIQCDEAPVGAPLGKNVMLKASSCSVVGDWIGKQPHLKSPVPYLKIWYVNKDGKSMCYPFFPFQALKHKNKE